MTHRTNKAASQKIVPILVQNDDEKYDDSNDNPDYDNTFVPINQVQGSVMDFK